MSNITRGRKKDQRILVKVVKGQEVYYQFNSPDLSKVAGVSTSDLSELGQINLNDPSKVPAGAIVFYNANAPKPPRVTRKLKKTDTVSPAQQSVSTFCSVDALTGALGKGWSIAKPGRGVSLNNTIKTVTALAELSNGVMYAFPMAKVDFESFGSTLGLKNASTITTDAERAKIVRASSFPKPGRATKILDDGSTFSSFYSSSKTPDGFNLTFETLL
jgi:hypothetical protein